MRATRYKSTKLAAVVTAAAMLGGVGSFALLGGTAEAIPAPQARCAFGTHSVSANDGWKPLGLGVTINNGASARRAVAQLAADIGVDTGAEVRVGYSIDGGPVREKIYGPGNLANHTEFWQTRSTIAVIPLSRGSHSVTPYWRISGMSGKTGFFEGGCFTVEGRTR
jgi:hypothetical protein